MIMINVPIKHDCIASLFSLFRIHFKLHFYFFAKNPLTQQYMINNVKFLGIELLVHE